MSAQSEPETVDHTVSTQSEPETVDHTVSAQSEPETLDHTVSAQSEQLSACREVICLSSYTDPGKIV